MVEAVVKCPKCDLEAVKEIGPMSNISFDFRGKEFYTVCPVITDKLDQRALEGPVWSHCPHFRDAATKARPQAA